MVLTFPRRGVATLVMLYASSIVAHAAVITDTITGRIGNFNGGIDGGGYFSAAGTNLTGASMTVSITYATSGPGVTYLDTASGGSLTYVAAAPGSFVETWTVGSTSLTVDLSNSGSISLNGNGWPSNYQIGGTPLGGGFVSQSNVATYKPVYLDELSQPISGTSDHPGIYNYSIYIGLTGYPTTTWIALESGAQVSGHVLSAPEPASIVSLGASLAGIAVIRRRRAV